MKRNPIIDYILIDNVSMNFSNKLIFLSYAIFSWGIVTKKSHLIRKRSSNGEIHLILQESKFSENGLDSEYLDETEIRKIMRKEASKPLLILREE